MLFAGRLDGFCPVGTERDFAFPVPYERITRPVWPC